MKHSRFFSLLADPIDKCKLVCIQNEIKREKETMPMLHSLCIEN